MDSSLDTGAGDRAPTSSSQSRPINPVLDARDLGTGTRLTVLASMDKVLDAKDLEMSVRVSIPERRVFDLSVDI